jgi:hypothetical protein
LIIRTKERERERERKEIINIIIKYILERERERSAMCSDAITVLILFLYFICFFVCYIQFKNKERGINSDLTRFKCYLKHHCDMDIRVCLTPFLTVFVKYGDF